MEKIDKYMFPVFSLYFHKIIPSIKKIPIIVKNLVKYILEYIATHIIFVKTADRKLFYFVFQYTI